MTEFADALGEKIQAALEAYGPHFWTTSQKGERWLQATCPFHDDKTPSFRYQPLHHVFYCHACAKTFTPMEVALALHVQIPFHKPIVVPPPPVVTVEGGQQFQLGDPLPTWRYDYHFPEGRLSHYVVRIEKDGKKEFPVFQPDNTPGLPTDYYPIYQPAVIQPGDYAVVVEGEKCVERVESVHDQLDHPIHAMTWLGGSGQAKKHALLIAAHLQKLQPQRIVLWPDNDEPGYKAMEYIATALRKLNCRYTVIAPNDLGLDLRQDVADYLLQGKSLSGALQQFQQEGSPDVAALVQKTLITAWCYLIVERTLYPIDNSHLDMLWREAYGTLPKRDQQRELHALLLDKARQAPTRIVNRSMADRESFYWRTTRNGRCLRIARSGIQMADDPPGWAILVRPEPPPYPDGYAPGTKADFDAWLDQFRLSETNKQLLEAWLCSTLLDLQTPVLLLRGPAGTGKTTLARSLLAIVEPHVPELPLSDAAHRDERGFIRILELYRALLLDNVSRLPRSMEDLLSKLVTGANLQLRTMYSDQMEAMHYRRSIVMTTIGYDIYQSDLSDRTIAMTPHLKVDREYESDALMKRDFDRVIDKIRGYIFFRCSEFYAKRTTTPLDPHFRIGDLGWVLATLGYDTKQIANDVRASHRDLVVQHDMWLDTIVGLFRGRNMDEWVVPTKRLTQEMGQRLEINDVSTIGVGRYLQEKEALFKDYGFSVEQKRGTGGIRLWRFYKIETSTT